MFQIAYALLLVVITALTAAKAVAVAKQKKPVVSQGAEMPGPIRAN